MNILLLGGLPDEYEGHEISTDFRNAINISLIMEDKDLSDDMRIYMALEQLYPIMPDDIDVAIKGMMWFYSRGGEGKGEGKREAPSFSFNVDADKIFAAFYATYGISLSTIEYLHWWEFLALFESLPDETLIRRVMYWRTADVSKMHKDERARILKMRGLYPLEERAETPLTREELEKQTKERVKERFKRAQELAKGRNNGE